MNDQLKALERAMQLERDGRVFYLKAAERTSSKRGREMFLSLADDEALHLRLLERQCNAITQNKCWASLSEVGEAGADWDKPIFPKDPALLAKAVHPGAGDTDALVFALQAEHQSFELYRKLAKESSDKEAQRMYRWLASIERGHFDMLMLNYESLLSSGTWAD